MVLPKAKLLSVFDDSRGRFRIILRECIWVIFYTACPSQGLSHQPPFSFLPPLVNNVQAKNKKSLSFVKYIMTSTLFVVNVYLHKFAKYLFLCNMSSAVARLHGLRANNIHAQVNIYSRIIYVKKIKTPRFKQNYLLETGSALL